MNLELADGDYMPPDWWPSRLHRAIDDTWCFWMRLSTGEVWFFEHAEVTASPEYVSLYGVRPEGHDALTTEAWLEGNERGIEVRVRDIVWLSEATT